MVFQRDVLTVIRHEILVYIYCQQTSLSLGINVVGTQRESLGFVNGAHPSGNEVNLRTNSFWNSCGIPAQVFSKGINELLNMRGKKKLTNSLGQMPFLQGTDVPQNLERLN